MRRFSVFSLLVVAALTLTAGVAPAVAQQNDTDARTVEVDPSAETDVTTYAQEIDSNLRLMEWEYSDDRGGFVLIFEADRSTRITMTEAVQFEEGAGEGRISSNRMPEGVSEVFFPVQRRGGEAAVTMTTHETLEEGRFAWVSTGERPPDRPPISYEKVRILVISTGLGAGALVFRTVRKKRENEDKEVERLL